MKTKVATALSIVGVLGAGSAAALVNTQILDSGPTESGASAAVLPPASSVLLTVPTSDPASTVPPTSLPVPSLPDPAPSGFLTSFNVGDAGVVTVDVVDGRLLLVSAEPAAGWSVVTTDDGSGEGRIGIRFVSDTLDVDFEADLVDGEIVPTVASSPGTGAAPDGSRDPAPAIASSSGTGSSGTFTSETVAANTVPSDTVTQNTVTQNTVPSNTVTENTVTENTVPSNTIDDDDDDWDDDDDDWDDDDDDDDDDWDDDDDDEWDDD